MPRTATAEQQLRDLYATLPRLECRGKCWDSCGSIEVTRLEQRIIERDHHITLPLVAPKPTQARCPALTMLGRCSLYADRPTICRLWGLVPSMRCNFGCTPEGGLMSERDGMLILARAYELAGDDQMTRAIRELWEDPVVAAATEKWVRQRERDRSTAYEVRARTAAARGTAVYMTASGALTKIPTEQAAGGMRC